MFIADFRKLSRDSFEYFVDNFQVMYLSVLQGKFRTLGINWRLPFGFFPNRAGLFEKYTIARKIKFKPKHISSMDR